MNPILADILSSGEAVLPGGGRRKVSSQVSPECGELLQAAIREVRPKVVIEVGLAFGVSTLYMLDALAETGGEKLIGMDPVQDTGEWQGAGLNNVKLAGHERLYEFHPATSQQVLPMLAGRGVRAGLGFIDGWHTFDHALIDFFYIDQMLEVGGILVLDDIGYAGLRRLAEFILANRAYEIHATVTLPHTATARDHAKQWLAKLLLPLTRTNETPDARAREHAHRLRDVRFLALKKVADDTRRWDHFRYF